MLAAWALADSDYKAIPAILPGTLPFGQLLLFIRTYLALSNIDSDQVAVSYFDGRANAVVGMPMPVLLIFIARRVLQYPYCMYLPTNLPDNLHFQILLKFVVAQLSTT